MKSNILEPLEASLIHRSVCQGVVLALDSIFIDGRYADRVIEHWLKREKSWGARDRHFFAEQVYAIVRWRRRLLWTIEEEDFQTPRNWEVLGAWLSLRLPVDSLPGWREWAGLSPERVRKLWEAPPHRSIQESLHSEFDEIGFRDLGDRWEAELSSMNQPARVYLRVNQERSSRDEVVSSLGRSGIEAEAYSELDSALFLKRRANVFRTDAFQQGLFEVQDAASQRVAPLLDPQPGERVIDACAGAGGKTLHIADLMKNKGRILALDIHRWKLDELKKRSRRSGFQNIEVKVIDSTKVLKRLKGSADRVLLDVPCTGSGVLRRNPDSKYRVQQTELDRLVSLQKEILGDYSRLVRPGGSLVYSTCSIFSVENERQVEDFLKQNNGEFERVSDFHIYPSEKLEDGFYGALLRRKE